MEFTCAVVYTITGWVRIIADNRDAAIREVKRLNSQGVDIDEIEDPDTHSECDVSDLEDSDGSSVYTTKDWAYEVGNGNTMLGYDEWLTNKVERDKALGEDKNNG
jgi:hypothetical protein